MFTYQDVLKEYCDLNDRKTLNVMLAINENDQNKALTTITGKLYDSVVDKVTDIDFGDIPRTKGDFTKLPEYDKINETVNLLGDLLNQYKQDTKPVDTIKTAIQNVIDRSKMFELAFKSNTELPMVMYNTICLSIISSVSYLISTSIEYIKDPGTDNFDITINKVAAMKSKESLLFNNLEKFNKSCGNKSFDKAMEHVIKASSENLFGTVGTVSAGVGIMQGAILVSLALMIVPMMRELIYFFYYSRVRVSDYMNMQADLLTMNAYRVERSASGDSEDSQKIAAKQNKIADLFRKSANTIEVSSKKADKETDRTIKKIDKKYNADEIFEDQAPDSASALF